MLLPTDIWVAALMRRAGQNGAFSVIVRRGDARAGAVLVRVVDRRATRVRLYAEALGRDGDNVWIEPRPGADETELEAYVARAESVDPDIWVVEIEDLQGRHFLTEPVETPNERAAPFR